MAREHEEVLVLHRTCDSCALRLPGFQWQKELGFNQVNNALGQGFATLPDGPKKRGTV